MENDRSIIGETSLPMRRGRASRFAVCALISILRTQAQAVLLDPDAPRDEVLFSLVEPLEKIELDVIQGRASAEPAANRRPRVSTMSGFSVSTKGADWSDMRPTGWTRGFEQGLVGVLLAVQVGRSLRPTTLIDHYSERCDRKPPLVDLTTCDFVRTWRSVPKEQRIFLAFTAADREVAENVGTIMKRAGFKVFLYLREGKEDPWAAPDLVGAVFAEAGRRYVLDTAASRGSAGVNFEVRACEFLLEGGTSTDLGQWYESLSD